MAAADELSPHTWTLRFKYHRSTYLLHVEPLQKLESVREELLKAVRETSLEGTLNGHKIPDDADNVLLARPVDINDLSQGWELIQPEDEDGNPVRKSKSKGKAAAGRSKTNDSFEETPQGAGLRDHGVVAFKFSTGDDDSEQVEWDVMVPTYEESYPEEPEDPQEMDLR